MDPMRAIGIILIASFLLDRIVAGAFFLLESNGRWSKLAPNPDNFTDPAQRTLATRRRKIIYAACVGLIGTVVISWFLGVRILTMTNSIAPDPSGNWFQPHAVLDIILTGLIFMGGADCIAEALKLLGAPGISKSTEASASAAHPIEITGKLILEREKETEAESAKALSVGRG